MKFRRGLLPVQPTAAYDHFSAMAVMDGMGLSVGTETEAAMKLTRSVSYAVGILLKIEQSATVGPMTAAQIARGCKFPPRFLYRILRRLVAAGLLRGTSGPGGGYALARQPREITLFEIVEGVESAPEATVLEAVCSKQRGAIEEVNRLCQRDARRFSDDLSRINLLQLSALGRPGKAKRAKGRAKPR